MPSAYLPMGVSHSDFARPRPASQVRALIKAAALFPAVVNNDGAWAALTAQVAPHFAQPAGAVEPVFSVDAARQVASAMTNPARTARVSPEQVLQVQRQPPAPETVPHNVLKELPQEDKVRIIASRYRR